MTAQPVPAGTDRPARVPPFLQVTCRTVGCRNRDKVQRVWLKLVAPGILAVPTLFLCQACGFHPEVAPVPVTTPTTETTDEGTPGMVLQVCRGCTTKLAAGLEACPHCQSRDLVQEGTEDMGKISKAAGPTDQLAGPGEAGFMPEVDGDNGPTQVPAAGVEETDATPPAEAPEQVDTDAESAELGAGSAGEQGDDPATGAESDSGGGMRDGDDPGRFTISQVTAHLDQASDEERTRVLDAERAGKNRKGIVGDG